MVGRRSLDLDWGFPVVNGRRLGLSTGALKYAPCRPYADSDATTRTLVDIASGIEPVPNGRICIDPVNAPFFRSGASGPKFGVGVQLRRQVRLARTT